MNGIRSTYHQTKRLNIHALERSGEQGGDVILFIHGNASSSIFWKGLMERISKQFCLVAPDLRGYGKTEDKLIDATRGFMDQTEDIIGLMDELDIDQFHVIGHSMGGGVVYGLLANYSERIITATLVNPVSPYGFGGTKGESGEPIMEDFAGTGAGVANPEFAKRIKLQDRTDDDPNASPRSVMNSFYWNPQFRPENEEELLEGLLEMKIGDQRYPGDSVSSENWPFVAPGEFGPVNAASPKYLHGLATKIIESKVKPSILWIRGSEDRIVSDQSLFDMGTLGLSGLIQGYPGRDEFPSQPMVTQTRSVLDEYQNKGGKFTEVEMRDTGHTPFIEKPETFLKHFMNHLEKVIS
jgi:pimeloyl-ACP methyl ester carboxylesterase